MSLPKIHCQAVRVPAIGSQRFNRAFEIEDLLPRADPYIAALIDRLEADIRNEVPPPLPGESIEFQSPGEGSWFWWEGR